MSFFHIGNFRWILNSFLIQCWCKTVYNFITELSLGEKLEEFRTVAKSYIEPSFTPIVGYNDHGAIVHYSANKE